VTTHAELARVQHLVSLGRGTDAVAEATRLLARSPDDAEVLRLLALAHDVAGDPAEAVSWARRAVAAAPDHARAHVALSRTLRGARRFQDAAVAAYEALRLAPNDPSAARSYAVALKDAGHWREAQWAARRAVELSPTDPASHLTLGYVLHHQQPEAARRAYEQCLRLDPTDALALQNLGALKSKSSPMEAIDTFAASLAMDPTLDIARRNLSRTLNRRLWLILIVTVFTLQGIGRTGTRQTAPAVAVVLALAVAAVGWTWFRLPQTVRRAWMPLVLPGLAGKIRPFAVTGLGLAVALGGCAWIDVAPAGALAPMMLVVVGVVVLAVGLVDIVLATRDDSRPDRR
jgi:Flp pilus assembly protein TadD